MRLAGRLALLALAACSAQAPGVPCPDGSCVHQESTAYYELNPPRAFDLLVVMDDSASMAARQDALVARLAPELDKLPGGVPELRVRVISSSLPAPGLAAFPGCAPAEPRTCVPAGGFLQATQVCDQHSNFSGSITDAFACAAHIGAAGCGWEQPLAATRAALEGDPQDGSRFLRRDAFLIILIVTDEDDCSAVPGASPFGAPPASPDDPVLTARCRAADRDGALVPVGDYVRFLQGLKPRPYLVSASVLAGWPADDPGAAGDHPACERDGSPVFPAVRLRAFVEAFEQQGRLIDLCSQAAAVEAALLPIGERLGRSLGVPCLPDGLLDSDPTLPGVQPSCTVTEATLGLDDHVIAERTLGSCDGGAPAPCWRVRDLTYCQSAEVERACQVGAPTRVTFRCATAPNR
jgi:hypothetical protein